MTRLDLLQALMAGAGISEFQAAKALNEHDRDVARRALAAVERRDAFMQAALTGALCSGRLTPPEQLVHEVLQIVDIMLKEIDK